MVLQSVGSDYQFAPTVTPFGGGGTGLVVTPTVLNGGIVNVEITNPGQGYKIGDIVQLAFSGGGSDPSAILVANLTATAVAAVEVIAQGRSYTTATVAFSGGFGSGAAATPVINSGMITAINVTAEGGNYTAAPAVTITGDGSGALAQSILNATTVAQCDRGKSWGQLHHGPAPDLR